jgi:micrococcal nuclease
MDNLTLLLFFISFISLIIGLIKPSAFRKIFKDKEISRKFILQVFGTASIVLFIITGVIASSSEQTDNKEIEPVVHQEIHKKVINKSADEPEINEELSQENESESKTEKSKAKQAENNTSEKYVFYPVTKVTDGDTIKVNINGTIETIRMIGLDTPETVDPRKPVQCFGIEASNRAKELLSNKKVRLEADPTQGDRGVYGRLLRYVWLEDGTLYNKKMISDGYAFEYTYNTPYKYQVEFKQAQVKAQNAKRGLWADGICDNFEQENEPSQAQSTETSSGGYKYYLSTYHTAKNYYCETDKAWKNLSEKYLEEYNSEQELLNKYPNRILHEQCE